MKTTHEAIRSLIKETARIAADLGTKERARLGRDLTEAEAARLADMVMRQLQTALVMVRR